jgi:hypothetical protein
MTTAAGIIIYIKNPKTNQLQFLLGFERNKWSGFVGGYEPKDKNIINTAIREFNEETAMVFKNHLKYINDKIQSNDCILINDTTPSGRLVYLWFVQMDYSIFYKNIPEQFIINRSTQTDKHFKEKSMLKWFTINQIKNGDVLFQLKMIVTSLTI